MTFKYDNQLTAAKGTFKLTDKIVAIFLLDLEYTIISYLLSIDSIDYIDVRNLCKNEVEIESFVSWCSNIRKVTYKLLEKFSQNTEFISSLTLFIDSVIYITPGLNTVNKINNSFSRELDSIKYKYSQIEEKVLINRECYIHIPVIANNRSLELLFTPLIKNTLINNTIFINKDIRKTFEFERTAKYLLKYSKLSLVKLFPDHSLQSVWPLSEKQLFSEFIYNFIKNYTSNNSSDITSIVNKNLSTVF